MLGWLIDFIILAFLKMTEASVLVFCKCFTATEVNVKIWKASFTTEKILLPWVVRKAPSKALDTHCDIDQLYRDQLQTEKT